MPRENDAPSDLLVEMRAMRESVSRIEKHMEKLDKAITGADDPRDGLAFRMAVVERHVQEVDGTIPQRVRAIEDAEESRKFWVRTAGTTGVGAMITAVCALIFKGSN